MPSRRSSPHRPTPQPSAATPTAGILVRPIPTRTLPIDCKQRTDAIGHSHHPHFRNSASDNTTVNYDDIASNHYIQASGAQGDGCADVPYVSNQIARTINGRKRVDLPRGS